MIDCLEVLVNTCHAWFILPRATCIYIYFIKIKSLQWLGMTIEWSPVKAFQENVLHFSLLLQMMTIVYFVPLCGQFKHLLMRRSNFLRILMTRINWYYELAVIIFDIIMFFVHLEVWYILKPHSAIHFRPVEMLIILFNCMQLTGPC